MSNVKVNNSKWKSGCCNICVHCTERIVAYKNRIPEDALVVCDINGKAVSPFDKCLSFKRKLR